MRVEVAVGGNTLSIAALNDPTAAHRYLIGVGSLHLAAVAGSPDVTGAGESPSLAIQFSNEGKRFSALTGWPMRARVDVFDDGDALFFSGLVSAITFGRVIEWTVQS